MKSLNNIVESLDLNLNASNNRSVVRKCNKVAGCFHDSTYGKASIVELEAVSRGQKPACDARVAYLEKQVEGFISWYQEKNPSADIHAYVDFVVLSHFDEVGDVPQYLINTVGEDRHEAEFDMARAYQGQLHAIAIRGERKWYGIAGMLSRRGEWLDNAQDRVASLNKELSLTAQLQDALDLIEEKSDGQLRKDNQEHRKMFKVLIAIKHKLDALKQAKQIGYETWVTFVNQTHALLGWKQIQPKEEWMQRDLPSRLSYWENRVQQLKAEIEELHAKSVQYEEVDADELDNQDLNADAVVQAFLSEM